MVSCMVIFQAGSPVMELEERLVGWWDLDVGRFDSPDLTGILGNGPVTGELS